MLTYQNLRQTPGKNVIRSEYFYHSFVSSQRPGIVCYVLGNVSEFSWLQGVGEDRSGWMALWQAGTFFTWPAHFLSFCKNYLPPSLQLPHFNRHFSGVEQNLATQNLCLKKSFWFVRYKFRVSGRVNRDGGSKHSSFLIWPSFSSFLPGMWLDILNSY